MKIPLSFYRRSDVCQIAAELLGKILVTNSNGILTRGIIVETEAYSETEKACHAYGKKITPRTEVLFREGGIAYVYLIYGIYHLFNIVTNVDGVGEAVLIRAIEPIGGIEYMKTRRGPLKSENALTNGPGKLTIAMGISQTSNGIGLDGSENIWVEYNAHDLEAIEIVTAKRVGVEYAGDDALLPWRFYIKDNKWVSKKV